MIQRGKAIDIGRRVVQDRAMITKAQLQSAGAGHDVEIIGYYRARVKAPAAATLIVREYALTKHPVGGTVPELYETVDFRETRLVSQGLPAVETFMEIVKAATLAEVI